MKRSTKPKRPTKRAPTRPDGTRQEPRPRGPVRPRVEPDRARWIVGLHSCREALSVRPKGLREIWLRDDWEHSQQLRELQELAARAKITIRAKTAGVLDNVAHGHQGVALAATTTPEVNWERWAQPGSAVVLILDGLEDPHNLGSILRTAWLLGVEAIFIPADRAAPLTPTVCKIASGGAEHVPVETETNLPSVMARLKELGFWIYGLAEAGKSRPWDLQLPEKVAWVVGSESSGLRKPVERACDELVRLPQVETGSSYNASIACAMALSETARQHGRP